MEEPRERVIRCQTIGQERQGEETYFQLTKIIEIMGQMREQTRQGRAIE